MSFLRLLLACALFSSISLIQVTSAEELNWELLERCQDIDDEVSAKKVVGQLEFTSELVKCGQIKAAYYDSIETLERLSYMVGENPAELMWGEKGYCYEDDKCQGDKISGARVAKSKCKGSGGKSWLAGGKCHKI